MQFVAYYRVSTDKQGKSGLGLESQQASVEQFITSRDGQVLEQFIEVESGKHEDRPELARALRRCRLSGATLVIAKLDRLSRDVEFIAKVQKSKVEFVCVDMPEANTLTIGMMAVLAQYEREMIGERTRAGLAAAKRRGTKLGNPNLHLVRCTDTRAATAGKIAAAEERNAHMRELIAEFQAEADEPLSSRALAKELNAAGYLTARGKAFTSAQVWRITTGQRNPAASKLQAAKQGRMYR